MKLFGFELVRPGRDNAPGETAELRAELADVRGQLSAIQQLAAEPSRRTPYLLDNPWHFWVTQNPKHLPGKLLDVYNLRRMADTYDVLRSCIEHIKREVASTPVKFVARDPNDQTQARARDIRDAEDWILHDDGPLGGCGKTRREFETELIEDLLVVGAWAVWFRNDRAGRPLEAHAIDASTIKPRVDAYGWPDRETPFEQYVQGVQGAGFRPGELRYTGIFKRSYSPYYWAPGELIAHTVMRAIYADDWNGSWLTEGNVRATDAFTLPVEWTPDQIDQWMQTYFSLYSGASAARQKTKFFPGGTEKLSDHSRKDQDFTEYERWLMRRTCSLFGVAPEAIGYATETYKASQEGAIDNARRTGVSAVVLELRRLLYDDILQRIGLGKVRTIDHEDEPESPQDQAERLTKLAGGPVISVNEAREELGRDPLQNGNELRNAPTATTEPTGDEPGGPDRENENGKDR